MICLTYGGKFNEQDLIENIRASGRDYIIQGQQANSINRHTKPQSLDYWLRQFASNPNTKQADNQIITALVDTGLFVIEYDLACPDSGRRCKGIRLS